MNRRHLITASSAAIATASLPPCKPTGSAGSVEKKTLTAFTRADYLSEAAKEGFEKAHNCTVVIDTIDSNAAMLGKLESGATNPLFPALRSGPTAVPGASCQKQIPSSKPGFAETRAGLT